MCVFCMIANKEIPTNILYEDADVLSFLDLSQANPGHALVIPKKHYANILEIKEEDYCKVMKIAKKIALSLQKTFQFDGINILNNCGEAAGQTVFHFHVHLIPRYTNDTVNIKWIDHSKEEQNLEELANRIRKNV